MHVATEYYYKHYMENSIRCKCLSKPETKIGRAAGRLQKSVQTGMGSDLNFVSQ